jgi:tRNA-splicing ligase RtcB
VYQYSKRLMVWASILEPETLNQAARAASMSFIYPHVALMADAHPGAGATIGSVVPTLEALMPACVGVDIGCGMRAVLTQFTREEVEKAAPLRRLHSAIADAIPLGFNYNTKITDTASVRVLQLETTPGAEMAERLAPGTSPKNWRKQLGSLGGGNHFIELSADQRGRVWAFLHSGSRGVGNKIAQHYIRTAQQLCKRRWICNLPDRDLAYLVEGDREFAEYVRDLRWAQRLAFLNREEMMDRVLAALGKHMHADVERLETVACHHNYTERERHFGKDVWLTRKGAIDASEGRPGLIPGSMGAASYVVVGKGNRLSLNSAPHGAGRVYGRRAAKEKFTRGELDAAMKGICWGESDVFLDEIPAAYKDIDQVMADSADLVEIRHTLRQFLNVKGD